jgi:glutamine synthetase
MSTLAERQLHSSEQRAAAQALRERLSGSDIEFVRLSWCDLHGIARGKTLLRAQALNALDNGLRMVGTLLLKDTAHRTAFGVFQDNGGQDVKALAGAADVLMVPDPLSFQVLPWTERTAWLQCEAYLSDGQETGLEPRQILRSMLSKLEQIGFQYQCGLELEFHIYRLNAEQNAQDPQQASWPPPAPEVSLLHPGYNLLTEQYADMVDAPLAIVAHTAKALGLPLMSLEVELGPSQVEAVFAPQIGMASADALFRFRNAAKQALRRAGYHATFMCRPRFENVMSSGWHLHQSLVGADGHNAFAAGEQIASTAPATAASGHLSAPGAHFLAGLLAHANACVALATPTINGYGRYQPNALAPQHIVWGVDNRGAMLRVLGKGSGVSGAATRIENRIGESAANPYLYMASQIAAGLDGMAQQLQAPPAETQPYASRADKLPSSLSAALDALSDSAVLRSSLGERLVEHFCAIKRFEIARAAKAADQAQWEQREYFNLF